MATKCRLALASLSLLALLLAPVTSAQAEAQIHVVQWGDTLAKIAQRYGVTIAAIQAANGLTGSRIFAGQNLVIPDAGSQAALQNTGGVHVVQAGETLFKIGLKYGLSWVVIQQANNLSGTRIYTGQKLIIPGASPAAAPNPEPAPEAAPAPAADASASGSTVHVVQRGDTLFKIGLRYNVSWTAIQAANGLSGTKIFVGQRLTIPSGSSPAASGEPAVSQGDGTNKRFVVDLSEQRLYAYEGDTLVRTTLVSTGTSSYPTVTGTFYIYLRYVATDMRGPGYHLRDVPYTMYFFKGYGLHGTYWHSNFGTPMSHGCVNMPTEEAKWAYYWSDYGTPVTVQW